MLSERGGLGMERGIERAAAAEMGFPVGGKGEDPRECGAADTVESLLQEPELVSSYLPSECSPGILSSSK